MKFDMLKSCDEIFAFCHNSFKFAVAAMCRFKFAVAAMCRFKFAVAAMCRFKFAVLNVGDL